MRISHLRPMKMRRFLFGAPYYPEHWDEATRKDDPERMSAAAFNVVRMAEFAWDMMEPTEGEYEFSFFDDAIGRLGNKGVKTILCTPTAAPPAWLSRVHPELMRMDSNGVRMAHGSRQHCCTAHPLFRKYSVLITEAMARHFSANPNVIGWQTDNEFNCHFQECHCPQCQIEFRRFLKAKFKGEIQALNEAWGTRFWAQSYRSFDDVETPRNRKPSFSNPAQLLDYYRFISHQVSLFQHEQVEILRKSQPRWFVTHNGTFRHIDYRAQFGKDLDFLGYDSYPMFLYEAEGRGAVSSFALDRMRCLTGNFLILEHQSGPGGQFDYFHDTPLPGEIRSMTYRSIARGADGILYFRWRSCRFGAEEYWCGILDHDNVPRRRYGEIAAIGKEMERVGSEILGTSVRLDVAVASGDSDVDGAHDALSLGLPEPDRIGGILHRHFLGKGYAVGCVHPEDELSGLKLYFIPHWELFRPQWAAKLADYVAKGGVLVVGARTATRDANNNVVAETPPGLLAKLAGIHVDEYGKQNCAARTLEIDFGGGRKVSSSCWSEKLQILDSKTVALAEWGEGHLKGLPAISKRKHGKGCVFYVGTYFSDELLPILLPHILVEASALKPLVQNLPTGVEVSVREDKKREFHIMVNGRNLQSAFFVPPKGESLVRSEGTKSKAGKISLPPFGVEIVRRDKVR